MRARTTVSAGVLAAGLLSLGVAPASAQGISDTLRNLFRYGGTTEPPAAPGRSRGD